MAGQPQEKKPDPDPVEVKVFVRVTIPKVYDIDLAQQTFKADLKLEAQWHPPDKAFKKHWETIKSFLEEKKRLSLHLPPMLTATGTHCSEVKVVREDCVAGQGNRQNPNPGLNAFEKKYKELKQEKSLKKGQKLEDEKETLLTALERFIEDEALFGPRLKFSNMISAETENENCTLGMEDAKPVIRYNLITKGTFQHTFKLKSFPFDDQTLAMELRTGFEHNHKKTPVLLMQNQDQHKYRSTVVTRGFTQASEYELLPGVRFQGGETEKEESSTGLTYSLLTIKLKVHRKSGYWVFNVVLPLGIVTSTLFATFSLPLTETNDRLNSSLTILLAMVAFKTFTAEKLPKVAYLSLVDWFILLSFVIAFVVVLMHAFFRCSSRPECMLRASVGANESRFFYRDPLYSSGDDDPLGNGYPCALVIGLGCYTVIIGLLLLGLTFCWRRGRKDWTDIENALWISPVRAEQGMGDKEIEEAVQEQLRAAALPEGKKPCVKVWTTSKAKEELKKREKELNSMFSLGKDAMGEAPFVVVTFANKEARDAALSEEKELCKNFREKYPKIFDSKCKIQPLQPTWYALSKTKGDTPTSTRMNTRKGYGSLAGYFLKGDPNVKLGLGSSTKLTASGKSPKLKGGVQTRMMTPSGPEPPATRQLSNDI